MHLAVSVSYDGLTRCSGGRRTESVGTRVYPENDVVRVRRKTATGSARANGALWLYIIDKAGLFFAVAKEACPTIVANREQQWFLQLAFVLVRVTLV